MLRVQRDLFHNHLLLNPEIVNDSFRDPWQDILNDDIFRRGPMGAWVACVLPASIAPGERVWHHDKNFGAWLHIFDVSFSFTILLSR